MNKIIPAPRRAEQTHSTPKHNIPDTHLSSVGKVLVRDSWNKFIAQDAVLIGLFFERLVTRAPEMDDAFGIAATQAPTEFLKLIDLAVRGLDPAVECPLREAYQMAPAARDARCRTIADCGNFFATYGMTSSTWNSAREAFIWAFSKAAYLEDYERADLALNDSSALARFFKQHVEAPMNAIREEQEAALAPEVAARMRAGAEAMLAHPQEAGVFFYKSLFSAFPDIVSLFRTANMDVLSRHLIETVVFLVRAMDERMKLRDELRNLARVHQVNQIPPSEYPRLAAPLLETLSKFGHPLDEAMTRGWEVLFGRVAQLISEPMIQQEHVLAEAQKFIEQVSQELGWSDAKTRKRLKSIQHEVRATGTYTHTYEELDYGAKLAWRNAPKCIGRISWKNLIVRDCRHITDADAIHDECIQHLRTATNGGNIEIVLTVFQPLAQGERWGPRLWNSQLVRYAGYELPDGTIRGDRANLELTHAIMGLGWTPPEPRGDYDILPLVVELPGQAPKIFPVDPGEVLEVEISHPTEAAIAELGMKWCAVPAISNFHLEIGGINYGCVPFNGWFMGTEIARNLWESTRYDRAAEIADALGLDTSSERTLWRDKAFLELNVAILHSFQKARVTLVDHQTASRQFMIHDLREKRAGRECPAQGSWIVPAAGGSTTPVWHHEMRDFNLKPIYKYAPDRWVAHMDEVTALRAIDSAPSRARTTHPLIIYASETGTAEGYAHQAARRLAALGPSVKSIADVTLDDLAGAARVLLFVATCRDGDVPESGSALLSALKTAPGDSLAGTRFAIMGIGNRIYPNFCQAAHTVDAALERAGAERMAALETADEIAGQADTVKRWIEMFFKRWGSEQLAQCTRRQLIELIPPQREPAIAPHELGVVRFNREMLTGVERTGDGAERSTRLIAIDLPQTPGSKGANNAPAYHVGDHVAVYPKNPPDLVTKLCEQLCLATDAWFRAHGASNDALERFRGGCSVWRLLSEDLDLTIPEAPEELLAAMHDAGGDGQDRIAAWLGVLNTDEDTPERKSLRDRMRQDYLTIVDLFEVFPDSVPAFEILIQLLPRLKPRLYSIASSPKAHPGQIRIIVSVLSTTQSNARINRGVASHYLAQQQAGTELRIALKTAARHLPVNPDGPILMIAAGTGIAPLIANLEERAARGFHASADRPVSLYFGCRNENEFLERTRVLDWRRDGILSRLDVAFSRAGPAKAYVQDALDANGPNVARELLHSSAHVMVCGDAKMAHDVENRLVTILQRDGGLSYSGAHDLLTRMRHEGRFIGDIWGIKMNLDMAVPAMQHEHYNRGAGWLARLKRSLKGKPAKNEGIRNF